MQGCFLGIVLARVTKISEVSLILTTCNKTYMLQQQNNINNPHHQK